MPTASTQLRASPVIKPEGNTDDGSPAISKKEEEARPRQSPGPNEESEDDRQYMMLRHSDEDEANGNGGHGGAAAGAGAEPEGSGEKEVGPHHIPKSPERASTAKAAAGPRSVSMRGRGPAGPPAASPKVGTPGGSHQYHHQQPFPSPMPFRVGPGGSGGQGSPPSYMRGVSEDANSLTSTYGAPYHHPLGPAPSYDPYDPAMALSVAPSWGSLDLRQGTFDYGDAFRQSGTFDYGDPAFDSHYGAGYNPNGSNVITPAQTIRKGGSAPGTAPGSPMKAFNPGGALPPEMPPTNYDSGYPGRGGPTNNYFMYPPSSPIKAGASPKGSPKGSPEAFDTFPSPPRMSPKVEPNEDEVEYPAQDSEPAGVKGLGTILPGERDVAQRGESDEEGLTAEWLPPRSTGPTSKNKRVTRRTSSGNERVVAPSANATAAETEVKKNVEPTPIHVPKAPGGRGVKQEEQEDDEAAARVEAASRTVKPQFARRQPSHAPKSAAAAGTPPRYRPPLVVDTSRSSHASTDSSESPGTSLYGGRVQLVGGGIGREWDHHPASSGAPWSLVSRSRSAESAGGSREGIPAGASNEWDPPRPTRQPMVPPPGRPSAVTKSISAPTSSSRYPEYADPYGRPPPRGYYPGYDYYRESAPPGAHPSHPGYPPSSYSPERPPPPPRSSSDAYPGYPGYPKSGAPYSGYPGHPSSQYPPHHPYSKYPPGHTGSSAYPGYPPHGPPPPPSPEDDDQPPPHPLLKDYNPHRDCIPIRPQFQNVKKSKAVKRPHSATTAAAASAGPHPRFTAPGPEPAGGPGGPMQTPRRRRRRNPTEKAAAAQAMAAAAEAALKERKEKLARIKAHEDKENEKRNAVAAASAVPTQEQLQSYVPMSGAAGVIKGVTEEELKTLGSGDDEDIPAAKRAAMASAVALRAAAGGSPVAPPKSAAEVDFDIADPPLSPICMPSNVPVLESATLMTQNDVLCGRGGGTNSQMGNRRFRALVRDFQPTYLMAKRREKPKMARSVVLIIRHRGGRFLRRDDKDGRLYEVGDEKAEAKTSQALREGLDVRATKTAANLVMGTSDAGKKRKTSPTTQEKTESKVVKAAAERSAKEAAAAAGRIGSGSGIEATATPARPQPVHAPGYGTYSSGRPAPSSTTASRPTRPPPTSASSRATSAPYPARPPPASASSRGSSVPYPPSGGHHPGGPPAHPSGGYYPPYPGYDHDPYYRSRYPPPHHPEAAAYEYGGPPPPPGSHYPPPPTTHHHHYAGAAAGGEYPPYPPGFYGSGYGAPPPSVAAYPSSPPRSSHKSSIGTASRSSSSRTTGAFSTPVVIASQGVTHVMK